MRSKRGYSRQPTVGINENAHEIHVVCCGAVVYRCLDNRAPYHVGARANTLGRAEPGYLPPVPGRHIQYGILACPVVNPDKEPIAGTEIVAWRSAHGAYGTGADIGHHDWTHGVLAKLVPRNPWTCDHRFAGPPCPCQRPQVPRAEI